MKTLVIVTRNKKKKEELRKLLNSVKIEVLSLDDIDINVPEIVEDGKTFRQNAIKKAVTISKIINAFVVADDSGLEVDYLHGKPGVRSSRFARAKATDQENNRKLIRLMKDIPEKMRGATFVCTIALADKGELIKCAQGTCKGRIGFESRGYNGFGYDPLFIPDGYKLTFAEMKSSFKNRISHRARALEKAKKIIQKYL